MEFATWEPIYERIIAEFGFDRADDERARDWLAERVDPFERDRLPFDGATVAVAGAAPDLVEERHLAREADVVVAASSAAGVCLDAGIDVDLLVTDLDGDPARTADCTRAGIPVAVHAHGDNLPALREWLPRLDTRAVLGTTQAEPVGPLWNPGGFTDGDRAAFLADELGAAELTFPGWSFDDPTVGPMKARKLAWAARLLAWLEDRRGERFAVLDGLRAGLEPVVETDGGGSLGGESDR